MIPFTRRYVDGPRELSKKQALAIRLHIHGSFVDTIAPIPLPDAFQRVGLQRKAARRLAQSPVFQAALALAQSERLAQEPQAAPSAPLAAPSPPSSLASYHENKPITSTATKPLPEGEQKPAPPAAADEGIMYVARLDVTHENVGAFVRVDAPPVGYVRTPPPPLAAGLHSGPITFDLAAHRLKFPFADPDAHLSRVIPAAKRRSFRRGV
jgi:hypothetical protein